MRKSKNWIDYAILNLASKSLFGDIYKKDSFAMRKKGFFHLASFIIFLGIVVFTGMGCSSGSDADSSSNSDSGNTPADT
ncbi:MAG: hypothetical protein GY705_25920, partial [Bacteroidetes bacterium]|nr:hypothetical protein [Bacteroidota bacterium]